jgi:hypothetical protein
MHRSTTQPPHVLLLVRPIVLPIIILLVVLLFLLGERIRFRPPGNQFEMVLTSIDNLLTFGTRFYLVRWLGYLNVWLDSGLVGATQPRSGSISSGRDAGYKVQKQQL